jgi:hypothetical protein
MLAFCVSGKKGAWTMLCFDCLRFLCGIFILPDFNRSKQGVGVEVFINFVISRLDQVVQQFDNILSLAWSKL